MAIKTLTYKCPICDEGYKTYLLFKKTSLEPAKTSEKVKDITLEKAAEWDCPNIDKLNAFSFSPFHELHSYFSKFLGFISISK